VWSSGDLSTLQRSPLLSGWLQTAEGTHLLQLQDGSIAAIPDALAKKNPSQLRRDLGQMLPQGSGLSPDHQSHLVRDGHPPVVMLHEWPDGQVGWTVFGKDRDTLGVMQSDLGLVPQVRPEGYVRWSLLGMKDGAPTRFGPEDAARSGHASASWLFPNTDSTTVPTGALRSPEDHIRASLEALSLDSPLLMNRGPDLEAVPLGLWDMMTDAARLKGDEMTVKFLDQDLAFHLEGVPWLGRLVTGGKPLNLANRMDYVSSRALRVMHNDPTIDARGHYNSMVEWERAVLDSRLERIAAETISIQDYHPVTGAALGTTHSTTVGFEVRRRMAQMYGLRRAASQYVADPSLLSARELDWVESSMKRHDLKADDLAALEHDLIATMVGKTIADDYVDHVVRTSPRSLKIRGERFDPAKKRAWLGDLLGEYADFSRTMILYGQPGGGAFAAMQMIGNAFGIATMRPSALDEYFKPGELFTLFQSDKRNAVQNFRRLDGMDKIRRSSGLGPNARLGKSADSSQPSSSNWFARHQAIHEKKGQSKRGKAFQVTGAVFAPEVYQRFASLWDTQIRRAVWKDHFTRRQRVASHHIERYGQGLVRRAHASGFHTIGINEGHVTTAMTNLRRMNGGYFSGEGLQDELLRVSGATSQQAFNLANRLGRDWMETLHALDDLAKADVDRIALSFRPKNIDEAIGTVVFFHYWASRTVFAYLPSMLRHPLLFQQFIDAAHFMENEADRQGWNDSFFGFFGLDALKGKFGDMLGTKFGFMTILSLPLAMGPLSNVMNAFQDSDSFRKDLTKFGELLDNSPFIPNPLVATLAIGLGLAGRDARLPSLTQTGPLERLLVDAANAALLAPAGAGYTGGAPSDELTARGLHMTSRGFEQMVRGTPLEGMIKGIKEPDLGVGNRDDVTWIMRDVLEKRMPGATAVEIDKKLGEELLLEEHSSLWNEAIGIWSKTNIMETTWNSFVPAPIRILPQNKMDKRERVAAGTATPTDYFVGEVATTGGKEDTQLALDTYVYRNDIGTSEQRAIYTTTQGIRNAEIPEGQAVRIKGEDYTSEDLAGLPETHRKDLAQEWIDENGGQDTRDELYALNVERLRYLEEHPDVAASTEWRETIQEFPGGAIEGINHLIEVNPGFAEYVRQYNLNAEDPVGGAKWAEGVLQGEEGYQASIGVRYSGYEENTDVGDSPPSPSADHASNTVLGARGIADYQETWVDLPDWPGVAKDREDIRIYGDTADAIMARINEYDPSGYTAQLFIDKNKGLRSDEDLPWDIYNTLKAEFGDPFAPGSASLEYAVWKSKQVEGDDISPEQYLREDIAAGADVQREERFAMREAGMPEENIIAIQQWKNAVERAQYDAEAGKVSQEEVSGSGLQSPGTYTSRNGKTYTVDELGNKNFEKGYISPDGQWHWYNDFAGGSSGGGSGWIPNKYGQSSGGSGWIPNKYGQDNRGGWVDYDVGSASDNINFRSSPGLSDNVRRVMHMGEGFSVLDESFMDGERWIKIRTSTGEMGWIMSKFAKRKGRGRSRRGMEDLGDRIASGVKARQYRPNT
jgi:hypothetical protein